MPRNTHPVHLDSSAGACCAIVAAAAFLLHASPAHGEDVYLLTGDMIRGPIVERNDEMLVIEHPVLGRMDIRMDQVNSVMPTPPPDQVPPTIQVQEVTPPPAEPESAPAEEKEWKFALNLAADGTWGNTDKQSVRFGFNADRERPDTRLAIDAVYFMGLTQNETTDNNFTAGVVHDWLMPESPWFYFAQARYDYDQFESWNQRVSAHGGPGYQLIDNDTYQLAIKAGPGVRREFGSMNDSWLFEAVFGLRFGWKISERSSFDFNSQYLPAVDDWTNDYRFLNTANYNLKLDPELNLSLVTGVRYEYQNLVDPGLNRNNTKVFVGLQMDF